MTTANVESAFSARARISHASVAKRPRRQGLGVFAAFFALYLGLGMWLTLRFNLVDGDGPSRVADAAYVLFSRDPHLGAVGFVWNPLPSLVELPLLCFRGLWPELQTKGQAATIQSALFMAAAVCQVRQVLLDRRVPNPWRWLLLGAFALNPMVVLFGGNGLSEAALVFSMTWTARRLMLWFQDSDPVHLAAAGLALAVGYTARYEALAASFSAALFVGLTAAFRDGLVDRSRARAAVSSGVHDVALLMFPVLLAFTVWAVLGWVLTDQPFQQFTSEYGNSSQLSSAHGAHLAAQTHLIVIEGALRRLVALAPLLPTLLVVAAAVGVRRRRADMLAPLMVFGGVLGFEILAETAGEIEPWLRFDLTAIPLSVCVAATLWDSEPVRTTPLGVMRAIRHIRARQLRALIRSVARPAELICGAIDWRWSWSARRLLTIGLLIPTIPVTWLSMLNPAVGNQFDQYGLRYIFTAARSQRYTVATFDEYRSDRSIAAYLDAQDLPRASVLLDTFQGWQIWLSSKRQQQFVITSDYDFVSVLDNPRRFGIRFILVSNPAVETVDAVNRRYPTLWANGAGLGTLQLTFDARAGAGPDWRLYHVNGAPS